MGSFSNAIVRVDKFWRRLGYYFSILGGVAVIFMVLLVVVDVTGRFVFNSPIKGGVETLELALPYVIFPALAYTLATGGHVRVTLLYGRLPLKLRQWADIFICLPSIFFLSLVVFGGWGFFWKSFIINEYMMAQVFLPWWVGKFALPLGIFVFLIQFIIRLIISIGHVTNTISAEVGVEKEAILAAG